MKFARALSTLVLFALLSFGATSGVMAQEPDTIPVPPDTLMVDTMQMMQDTLLADTMQMEMMQDTMMADTMQMEMPVDPTPAAEATIVEVASEAGNFSTFTQAVEAANLGATLEGSGPYTVFAPTDAAFDRLPPGTLDELLNDPARLREVLLNHVVSGEIGSAEVAGMNQLNSVGGGTLRVSTMGGDVMVGNATVSQTDINAGNGIIHAIDTVLMPAEPVTKDY